MISLLASTFIELSASLMFYTIKNTTYLVYNGITYLIYSGNDNNANDNNGNKMSKDTIVENIDNEFKEVTLKEINELKALIIEQNKKIDSLHVNN